MVIENEKRKEMENVAERLRIRAFLMLKKAEMIEQFLKGAILHEERIHHKKRESC